MDKRITSLPTDSAERKEYSLGRGCYAYFPAALAGVARHSFKAGAKHTGGELVHNRWLSDDAEDCVERHMMDIRDLEAHKARNIMTAVQEAEFAQAIMDEANALTWRAMEVSQKIHEKYGGAPLAPAARLAPAVDIRGTSAAESAIPPAMREADERYEMRCANGGAGGTSAPGDFLVGGGGAGGQALPSGQLTRCRCRGVFLSAGSTYTDMTGGHHTVTHCSATQPGWSGRG